MCNAITEWIEAGEPVFHRCSQSCKGLCCYHRKMKEGLLTPEVGEDKQNRPVKVFTNEETLWTA